MAVCTNGFVSMTAPNKGFKGIVLETAPHVKFTHFIIHREAPASKQLSPELRKVLCDIVKIVNFRRPL